jgi:hypothetical protein|tara:strand:+ start:2246 stop:2629 length:384 start_codon:yes stop_codon:yes gene_type:complete
MNQLLIGIILVLGLGGYWLYQENQTLASNNLVLEGAVAEQKAAFDAMKDALEKQGQSLQNMSRRNAEIEAEKAEYLSIFSRHNLDMLAIKKPGLMESRFNKGSISVMEGIEDDTKKLNSIDNPSTDD